MNRPQDYTPAQFDGGTTLPEYLESREFFLLYDEDTGQPLGVYTGPDVATDNGIGRGGAPVKIATAGTRRQYRFTGELAAATGASPTTPAGVAAVQIAGDTLAPTAYRKVDLNDTHPVLEIDFVLPGNLEGRVDALASIPGWDAAYLAASTLSWTATYRSGTADTLVTVQMGKIAPTMPGGQYLDGWRLTLITY